MPPCGWQRWRQTPTSRLISIGNLSHWHKSIPTRTRNSRPGNSPACLTAPTRLSWPTCQGLAAKRQGPDAFKSFLVTLLKARHEEKKDLNDPEVMREAAVAAGLDVARFLEDQADPELLQDIADSHTKAVEEHGVFGVPTYVFPGGNAAFLKMFIPPDEQAPEIFESVTKVMGQFEHVGEMKRPQPPWPHGVIRG